MTRLQKNGSLIIGFGVLAILGAMTLLPSILKANPLEFLVENSITGSVVATTSTLGYLSPGTGTTTIPAYDTYNYGNADTYATNNLALLLLLTGSTSPSGTANYATTTYNIALEYSQNNIDWYSDAYSPGATTSPTINVKPFTSRTITLGSTTLGGVTIATTTPTTVLVNIQAPTRYVRAIVSIPNGSTNGSVWGQFVGQKQTAN